MLCTLAKSIAWAEKLGREFLFWTDQLALSVWLLLYPSAGIIVLNPYYQLVPLALPHQLYLNLFKNCNSLV